MIDQVMEPVIIARDDAARRQVAKLGLAELHSGPIARALQAYTVQIPAGARELLQRTGKGAFQSPELRGDQFFVLTDDALYHADSGLWWEQADYLRSDHAIL
jgi:CRISPR-associated endonuclease/helicase Cas3